MKENSVFVIKDGIMQCKIVDWSHLPVRENIVTDAEKRIKDIIAHK